MSCRPGGTVLRRSLQCCLLQSPANTTSISKAYTANGRAVHFGRCAYKECLGKIKQQLAKLSFSYYRLGTDWLGIRSVAKDLGILEDSKLNAVQQCALTLKRLTASRTVISRSIAIRLREAIISFKLALVRPHLENSIQFWAPVIQERHG